MLLASFLAGAGCHAAPRWSGRAPSPEFRETIAGTAVSFDMVPVPADDATGLAPFWIGRTEVTWDEYDVFVYGLDSLAAASPGTAAGTAGSGSPQADAVTRPSKPYISMDRGFGHAGWPAISMSFRGAQEYCRWLSAKTGRRYRLPTEREWRHACALGAVDPAHLADYAWYRDNADHRTHRVAGRAPSALGIFDQLGNASEWCVGDDGAPVTLGGCYRDEAAVLTCPGAVLPSESWNRSDPQMPKSTWWLADAGFVGLRLVCEAPGDPP